MLNEVKSTELDAGTIERWRNRTPPKWHFNTKVTVLVVATITNIGLIVAGFIYADKFLPGWSTYVVPFTPWISGIIAGLMMRQQWKNAPFENLPGKKLPAGITFFWAGNLLNPARATGFAISVVALGPFIALANKFDWTLWRTGIVRNRVSADLNGYTNSKNEAIAPLTFKEVVQCYGGHPKNLLKYGPFEDLTEDQKNEFCNQVKTMKGALKVLAKRKKINAVDSNLIPNFSASTKTIEGVNRWWEGFKEDKLVDLLGEERNTTTYVEDWFGRYPSKIPRVDEKQH